MADVLTTTNFSGVPKTGVTGLVSGLIYAPILTLPATASSTYDQAIFSVGLGGLSANTKKDYYFHVGQREGLFVHCVCFGNKNQGGAINAYQQTNGTTILYLVLTSFVEYSLLYSRLNLATGVSDLVFSATEPTGTLVYSTATTPPTVELLPDGINVSGLPVILRKPPVIVSATSQQTTANTEYKANSTSRVVFTLPLSDNIAVGDTVSIFGYQTGGWRLAQNAGQIIHIPVSDGTSDTTIGTGGYIESGHFYNTIVVKCINYNHFTVVEGNGDLTIV